MKKLISVLLSLIIALSMFVPVSAAEGEKQVYEGYPLVVVRGIDFTGLHFEDGTPTISISFRDILDLGKNYFKELLIEKNEDAFFDSAFNFVENLFEYISCDENGDSKYELFYDKFEDSLAEYPEAVERLGDVGETGLVKTAVDKIGAENVYYFTYDWRKSAKELASGLDAFIGNVIEKSDKEKVNIVAVSMGGMVTSAYMYFHGADYINNLTFMSSAHNGTYIYGDSINGNIYFDGDVIYNTVADSVKNSVVKKFFVSLIDKIGVFDAAASIGNKIVEDNPQVLRNDALRSGFGTLLGLWAMCPDDVFESGVDFMFSGYENDYPVLMEKISETKNFIFATEDIIDSAIDKGIRVNFVSNYGKPLTPVVKHSDWQSDGVLATVHTSNFATVAPYGEVLTQEQIDAADEKYLSPDKSVDASTALYRDVTWFVKDAPHVAADYDSEYADFVLYLVLSDRPLTVESNEKYPQFMILDSENRLVADK